MQVMVVEEMQAQHQVSKQPQPYKTQHKATQVVREV
jgi:hypothetical protein